MGATGSVLLDFGAFPGSSHVTMAVTGQAGILSTSRVEAWIEPAVTADHSSDEHVVDPPRVTAGTIVAGTGFTIEGVLRDQPPEPSYGPFSGNPAMGGGGLTVYGKWNVAWAWN